MSIRIQKVLVEKMNAARLLTGVCALLTAGLSTGVNAQSNQTYSALPPIASREVGSIDIMLTLSVDHQLFREAYNDYDDIYQADNEPIPRPEVTYEHNFTYAGYFNSELCYSYQTDHFAAIGAADDEGYCVDGEGGTPGGWSGNFLNWVSMTRLDMVRQVLYGGHRSTDEANQTILERAPLVQDAHSFAKYYNGGDIEELTDNLPALNAPGCGTDDDDRSCQGYTFCNTSAPVQNLGLYSHQYQNLAAPPPPLIRAVKGNYSLWASNERFQCVTLDEIPTVGWSDPYNELDPDYRDYIFEYGVNGNRDPEFSGIWAKPVSPHGQDSQVTDFIARVEVCNQKEMEWQSIVQATDEEASGAGGQYEPRCQNYPGEGVSSKPIGLLQDSRLSHINFGLLTGSYDSNMDWGVLRKGVTNFNETEVNENGTFVASDEESIVNSLNALRLVDYQFFSTDVAGEQNPAAMQNGTYNGIIRGDNLNRLCEWGYRLDADSTLVCRNWGNPFGELLAESYRYFAAKAGVANVTPRLTAASVSVEMTDLPGLTIGSWPSNQGESTSASACTSRNVLAFNASGISYDDSVDTQISQLFGNAQSGSVADWVNKLGNAEVTGTETGEPEQKYFFGMLGEGSDVQPEDGQCSAKSIGENQFSLVNGICPETPRLDGSYYGAGLAYFAHTQDLNPTTEVKETVSTYGITLAGALPNIQVNAGNENIVIIPACRNRGENGVSENGNCALVDFRPIIPQDSDAPVTEYYVGWEDSEQGGDYDLDLSGIISYEYNDGANLKVTTKIVYESANEQMEFGFSISGTGTIRDSVYFPSVIKADKAFEEINDWISPDGWGYNPTPIEALQSGDLSDVEALQRVLSFNPVEENTSSSSCDSTQEGGLSEMPVGVTCESVPWESADNSTSRNYQVLTIPLENVGDAKPGKFLKDPLYYAVKWGSFDYNSTDEDPQPADGQWESDRTDQFGDPLPRGYDTVRNPKNLKTQFADIIDSLLVEATAGTASGIAANTSTGEGLSIQTFYVPELRNGDEVVTWSGAVSGVFRDQYGYLREDTNGNGKLDNPGDGAADRVVEFFFDSTDKVTKARVYEVGIVASDIGDDPVTEADDDAIDTDVDDQTQEETPEDDSIQLTAPYEKTGNGTVVTMEQLNYVWDLNTALNAIEEGGDYLEQSTLSEALNGGGRRILTAIDGRGTNNAPDGIVTDDEVIDFVIPATEDDDFAALSHYLDIPATDESLTEEKLIGFVRGVEGQDGVRSRTLGEQAYRVGDVMHSTPTVVGAPRGSFDRRLGDNSYAAYRSAYANRRQVAYVGGNDGMLRAINLGFYDNTQIAFFDNYSEGTDDTPPSFSNADVDGGNPTTLGNELWGYVPFNLLPHLKWLASPNYQHVYYMDGAVQTFDVKIFPESETEDGEQSLPYPGGWGTIIVAGMRLGGGPYSITDGEDTTTLRSAYVIFDVTDPLNPKLLGEITHPDLGFTTSNVEVMVRSEPFEDGGENDWYLVFGSGPTDLTTATSEATAKLFYVDLKSLVADPDPTLTAVDTDVEASFVGGVTVEDWNNNYQSNNVYFGLVGNDTEDGSKGALMYSELHWDSAGTDGLLSDPARLLDDVDQPFSAAPIGVSDKDGNHWLFAGTGRYYSSDDMEGDTQNTLYGIRVNATPYGAHVDDIDSTDLLDVTDISVTVHVNNGLRTTELGYGNSEALLDPDGNPISTVEGVTTKIQQEYSGWKRNYQSVTEKNFLSPLVVNDTLISDTFKPASTNTCDASGSSFKYILDVFNGLPQTRLRNVVVKTDNAFGAPEEGGSTETGAAIESDGQISGSSLLGDGQQSKFGDGSTEEIDVSLNPLPPKRQSWREIPLDSLPTN